MDDSFSALGYSNDQRRDLAQAIERGGADIVVEFSCPGFDTFRPLWLTGGLHRGRPNENDLARAAELAKGLLTLGSTSFTVDTPLPR